MRSNKLEDKLKQLPTSPGVYLHRDKTGNIIYVGKAANLSNRVKQYFQPSTLKDARQTSPKTAVHITKIADFEWIETDSEVDALFLEAELIKRYKPKYNIDLRDDKSLLYVRINMKDRYPYVAFTRRPLDDGAEYFGPYESSYAIKRALRYLRRVFPYSTHRNLPKRVCLQYHLGLCPGVEENKISSEHYKRNLKKLISYIRGQRVSLIKQMEREMKIAASAQKYEEATQLRNQIYNLKALRRQIIFGSQEFIDISKDQALHGLIELAGLKHSPRRIEGYDISHMQGTDNVASMVVFTNGLPDKAQYRKFKLRRPGNDDYAHINEVITRRFSGRNLNWPKPDLLLIDGGKGQLRSAIEALAALGIMNLPAIGLAKREEKVIVSSENRYKEIVLDRDSQTLKLLQRIRDESHRFAVSYHSILKIKRQKAGILEEIPGIGRATSKKLLRKFGSVAGIKRATNEELAKVVGKHKAGLLEAIKKTTN